MSKQKFLPLMLFVVSAAIIFSWHQFFYETTQREILAMELETRRLRDLEREISELKARHADLSAFVAANEQRLDEARIFLPSTPAQDKFIDELYQAAEAYRVQLVAVQADEVISAEEIESQLVNVSVEADYVSMLNFIRETLDGGRLVSLEKFSAESIGGNVLSCELTFKIFSARMSNQP